MFDIQLFAEAVAGKRIVYPIRIKDHSATEDGTILSFVTENGRTKSRDADSIATKDGTIRTPGSMDQEITVTCVLAKGDTRIDELEDAMDDGKLIEVWEANLDEPIQGASDQFKGMYFQGYITNFEKTSNAEDQCEISITIGINGNGARPESGGVTVDAEQQEAAQYAFVDTPKGN